MIFVQEHQSKPAILGGKPICQEPMGIVQPNFPDLATIAEPLSAMLNAGQLTNHCRYVPTLEEELTMYLHVPHCVAVSNGTMGLILALAGLQLTGEVILPSFTYSATAHALAWAELEPVFADICPDTFNLDPQAVEAAITPNTSAILAVHVYGHPCDVEGLQRVAERYDLALIFDAAHAFGATYRGRPIGGFGHAEVFSFHATKLFPVGEGGCVTTTDPQLAEYVDLARKFGNPGGDDTLFPGLNAKMQEFNALLGLENLKAISQVIENRRAYAAQIQERLSQLPGLCFQKVQPDVTVTYQNLALLIDEGLFGLSRDKLHKGLEVENVLTRKYFYPPLHQHTAYAKRVHSSIESLPCTEKIANNVLCLPIYSIMEEETIDRLCEAIERLHQWSAMM
ncbi:MAG: DegT/DnrJ/EryC1/StrS family aminotransferase [Chloroflexota bacterium]